MILYFNPEWFQNFKDEAQSREQDTIINSYKRQERDIARSKQFSDILGELTPLQPTPLSVFQSHLRIASPRLLFWIGFWNTELPWFSSFLRALTIHILTAFFFIMVFIFFLLTCQSTLYKLESLSEVLNPWSYLWPVFFSKYACCL